MLDGVCDVLVCDGFVGNILLKSLEGTSKTIFSAVKKQFMSSFVSKLAASVLSPGLRKFRAQMDYREYGGAPLFGLAGICVKGHGSSDARAVYNAIRQTRNELIGDLVGAVSSEFTRNEGKE